MKPESEKGYKPDFKFTATVTVEAQCVELKKEIRKTFAVEYNAGKNEPDTTKVINKVLRKVISQKNEVKK
jgi:hypothetical protein